MSARDPLVLGGGDVPAIAWPALHSDKIAPLAAHIHQLEASQWLPRAAIEAGQRAQRAAITRYFAENVPAFAARLAGQGLSAADLATPEGFASLTPITRRDVIREFEAPPTHALPAGHGSPGAVRTSGSTGEPVTIWKTAVTNLDWLALTIRYHRWGEPDFGARLASLRAYKLRIGEFPDWGTPISHFFATGPMLSLASRDDIDALADRLIAFSPESLLCYPSQIGPLMRVFAARGVCLPSLKNIRTMGEVLPPDLRTEVAANWNVPIHDCYSSEEAGYIAVQCPASELYHSIDESLIVEIVDEHGRACAPGETGRVIVTDLRNHATPLIRYAIGDHATRGGDCPCGRGLATIERIAGRTRNMIRNPDGTRRWPVISSNGYRDIAPVLQAQIVQHSPTQLEARIVSERPVTRDQEDALRRLIVDERLRQPFALSFNYFEGTLPVGPSGKFEEFVSMVEDA